MTDTIDHNLQTLHVGQPNLGDRETFDRLVNEMFESRWFTNNGRLVQRLEYQLQEYLGVKHVILVNNGTTGLQLAAAGLGLTGEVILPAFTFVATAHALQFNGIKPVFCDVDPLTHNIDPAKIEALITERTSAILGVHVWGNGCPTAEIETVAQRHNLEVFYDSAHAFGCRHGGRMIGGFGRCEVFSFHATKFFHTFEGGAVTTNDDNLAEKIRLMRNFGFECMDRGVHLGINGKMPEICAAMGLASLETLDEVLQINRRNHQQYRQELAGATSLRLREPADPDGSNYQYIIAELDADARMDRDHLVKHLHDQQIRARRYFYPACHRMEPYCTLYPEQLHALSETDRLCERVIALPTGSAVTSADISRVCGVIRHALSPNRRAA